MFGFSKKRFLITLLVSIVIWFISVLVQFFTLYKVKFSLFSGTSCQLTGFPWANCIYEAPGQIPFWVIDFINILFWFWVIHLFWGWFQKSKG